jgi:outer membrane cobalamin receptor
VRFNAHLLSRAAKTKTNKLKLKLGASCIAVMLTLCGFAQNVSVRVSVKNEKKETVQNATVQVLRVPDSAGILIKTLKGNNVLFSLRKNTPYILRVSSVEITGIVQRIKTGNNDTLININAQTLSANMTVVTVNSRKPFVKQEDDKTVVDAEALVSSSTNAYEVLEKTPGAVVDQDGNVYLNSATPATIFINGREVKLSAEDLASLLKSLPANSISKIEILRNPSAKYDAASSGGIVNIVLKKGVKLGVNGSLELTHFQGKFPTNTVGFNINDNSDKLSSYLSANITRRTNFEVLTSDRPVSNILFTQSSFTRYPNLNKYIGGGLDYELNKKWSISYDGRLVANNNKSRAENDINIFDEPSLWQSGHNISFINNAGPSYYLGNNISTKYKIDSSGSNWENSLDINFSHATNGQDYNDIFLLPPANTKYGDGTTHTRRNTVAFKSDLLLKLKSGYTIETGTKLSFSNNRNDAAYFADTAGIRFVDVFQSNNFRYKENIAAIYFQVSKTFAGFTLKPGLRLEYTDIRGHQLYPFDTGFAIKRTDLFPYVYLRHQITKLFGFMLTGNAIYRKSITRPSYDQLNPYPKFIDQYTFDIGNPGLQPQFTTNYEFNIMADEYPVFSAGLNDIKDIFNNLTYQKGTTLFRTYDNLGKNKEFYLRATGGIPPGKKYFFYAGVQLNSVHYNGEYASAPFHFTKSSWTFFMFHNYKPMPTLNLSLSGFMRTNSVINFFQLKTFGGLSFSANKSILQKRMNIVVAVNDILRTNRNQFVVNVPGFMATGMRYGDTRRVGLTLKYNFGMKPKEEKKENYEPPPVEGS